MRFLVVGLGSMGRRRLRCLARLGAGPAAGVDLRAERREGAAASYGITSHDDLEGAFAAFRPDAVISSLPPDQHVPLARRALTLGKHVFCEAGTASAGMEDLVALARRAGRVAAPSCTMRFHPAVKRARDLLAAGAIGRVLAFTHHVGQYLPDWHPFEDYRSFYASRRETGACREIVPFELTWLDWLMGGEPEAVRGMKGKLSTLDCDIDDVYQLLLRYPGGALGHLLVDAVARSAVRATRFVGERGTLEWHAPSRLLRLYDAGMSAWTDYPEPPPRVEPGYGEMSGEDMYLEETAAFVAACRGEAPYTFDFAANARILRTLVAAEQDADRRGDATTSGESGGDDDDGSERHRLTHRLIPGGAHTYSKGDDQFPANAPRYLERGEGCHVWDDHGREYLDWTSGLRTMSLGYGVRPVLDAAIAQLSKGLNFGRPSFVETQLAQDLVELIPGAEMVKLAKNGSTATTAAVKLARAFTGRDLVALCADHLFLSYDDWFIGTTSRSAGVPAAIRQLSLTFPYGNLAALEGLFAIHPGAIACVILEAATTAHPSPGYLAGVKELCRREGAVLVFDEMITGFRWHLGGAQAYYGVTPDLATFGKGMANGFAVSALVGCREIMELGGIAAGSPRVFLVSTTHGAEVQALAAARATLRFFREQPVIDHMTRIGQALIDGLNDIAAEMGVAECFAAGGVACSPWYLVKDRSGAVSLPLRTLFLEEMVRRGVLINYLAPGWSHGDAEVEATLAAARASLRVVARALDEGWVYHLRGAPIRPVFG
jgi:glutamate-1-semialdehyde 2,1-aminomutase